MALQTTKAGVIAATLKVLKSLLLEVLVEREEFRKALSAAQRAGLGMPKGLLDSLGRARGRMGR